jgi:hypothetical protein
MKSELYIRKAIRLFLADFYVFAEHQLSPSLIKLHFTFIILTFNVSIVKH